MATGCTVVTPLAPDPAAILQLVADLDPDYRVYTNEADECWEVIHPTRAAILAVVDLPRRVRVPGELQRLWGSDLGIPQHIAEAPEGLYWLDVHTVEQSEDAERFLILFSLNLAERGHGAYVEHSPTLDAFPATTVHLGLADSPEGWERNWGKDPDELADEYGRLASERATGSEEATDGR